MPEGMHDLKPSTRLRSRLMAQVLMFRAPISMVLLVSFFFSERASCSQPSPCLQSLGCSSNLVTLLGMVSEAVTGEPGRSIFQCSAQRAWHSSLREGFEQVDELHARRTSFNWCEEVPLWSVRLVSRYPDDSNQDQAVPASLRECFVTAMPIACATRISCQKAYRGAVGACSAVWPCQRQAICVMCSEMRLVTA